MLFLLELFIEDDYFLNLYPLSTIRSLFSLAFDDFVFFKQVTEETYFAAYYSFYKLDGLFKIIDGLFGGYVFSPTFEVFTNPNFFASAAEIMAVRPPAFSLRAIA